MRVLIALALLVATPAAAEAPITSRQAAMAKACGFENHFHAIRMSAAKAAASPLAQMPSVNMELAVLRRVGGCPIPVIVRYGVDKPKRLLQPKG